MKLYLDYQGFDGVRFEEKFGSCWLRSFCCWHSFGLLRFSEKLPNSILYKRLHEFLDSHRTSRRINSVGWHDNRTDRRNQKNINLPQMSTNRTY